MPNKKAHWDTSVLDRTETARPSMRRRSINSPLQSLIISDYIQEKIQLPEISITKVPAKADESEFGLSFDYRTKEEVGLRRKSVMKTWTSPFPYIAKLHDDIALGLLEDHNSCKSSEIEEENLENQNAECKSPTVDTSLHQSVIETVPDQIGKTNANEAILNHDKQKSIPAFLLENISLTVAARIEKLSRELRGHKGIAKISKIVEFPEQSKDVHSNIEQSSTEKDSVLFKIVESGDRVINKISKSSTALYNDHSLSNCEIPMPLRKISNSASCLLKEANDCSLGKNIASSTKEIRKSKSLDLFIGRSRHNTVSSFSSPSETMKANTTLDHIIVNSDEQLAVKKEQEGLCDIIVKKNIRKKLRGNPLTKLTISNYDLLSRVSGAFRSPDDIYYKFIYGGKSIREEAIKLKEHKILEIDHGKLDRMIAAESMAKNGVYHRVVATSREKYKTAICTSIDVKVTKLEELRAYIITTIRKINSSKKYMAELELQNRDLGQKFSLISTTYHKEVAETIETNDLCTERINYLETTSSTDRTKIIQEFSALLKQQKEEKTALQTSVKEKSEAFQYAIEDFEDLIAFEQNTALSPNYTIKEICKAIEEKRQHQIDLDQMLIEFHDRFRAKKNDYNTQVREIEHTIFQKAIKDYDAFVDSIAKAQYLKNLDLKDEISRQNKAQNNLKEQIKKYSSQKRQMESDLSEEVDSRRQVTHLVDFMNCKPDMKITIR